MVSAPSICYQDPGAISEKEKENDQFGKQFATKFVKRHLKAGRDTSLDIKSYACDAADVVQWCNVFDWPLVKVGMHCVIYKHVKVGPQVILSSCNVVKMHRSVRRRCRKTSIAWSVSNQSGEKIQNPMSGVVLSSMLSIQPVGRSFAFCWHFLMIPTRFPACCSDKLWCIPACPPEMLGGI